MNKYETTFILGARPRRGQGQRAHRPRVAMGQELGGEVLDIQRWGKRRLSYEIHRKRDGIYTLMLYQGRVRS